MNQGPTVINSSSRVCGLCQFHRQHMLKSGESPEYKHFCGHPASVEWVKSNEHSVTRELLHSMLGSEDEDGRDIGYTDNTPEWCPVVAESLSGKAEPLRPAPLPSPDLAAVGTDGLAGTGAKRTEADTQRLVGLTASPDPGLTAGAPVSMAAGESEPADVLKVHFTFDPARCNHMGGAAIDCPHCLRRRLAEAEEALEIVSLINTLCGETGSGDSLKIHSPTGSSILARERVVCRGQWTGWEKQPFDGVSLLAALRKAAEAKRAKGGANA